MPEYDDIELAKLHDPVRDFRDSCDFALLVCGALQGEAFDMQQPQSKCA